MKSNSGKRLLGSNTKLPFSCLHPCTVLGLRASVQFPPAGSASLAHSPFLMQQNLCAWRNVELLSWLVALLMRAKLPGLLPHTHTHAGSTRHCTPMAVFLTIMCFDFLRNYVLI